MRWSRHEQPPSKPTRAYSCPRLRVRAGPRFASNAAARKRAPSSRLLPANRTVRKSPRPHLLGSVRRDAPRLCLDWVCLGGASMQSVRLGGSVPRISPPRVATDREMAKMRSRARAAALRTAASSASSASPRPRFAPLFYLYKGNGGLLNWPQRRSASECVRSRARGRVRSNCVRGTGSGVRGREEGEREPDSEAARGGGLSLPPGNRGNAPITSYKILFGILNLAGVDAAARDVPRRPLGAGRHLVASRPLGRRTVPGASAPHSAHTTCER